VVSIDGDSITTKNGSAKGVTHDILVVDGFTMHDDSITDGAHTFKIGDTIVPTDFINHKAAFIPGPSPIQQQLNAMNDAINLLLGV
jgi:hypothetical protein